MYGLARLKIWEAFKTPLQLSRRATSLLLASFCFLQVPLISVITSPNLSLPTPKIAVLDEHPLAL